MEKNNFSSWAHHKVRRGENLGMIARKYGISVSEIKQANNMKNSRIRVGRNLLIPVKVKPRKSSGKKPAKVKIYVAKLGDNIASVARMYGVSQESLRTWNSMSASAMIKSGDTLFVSKPELKPASVTPTKVPLKNKYVVESGDTYASIAKLFGIPVVSLLYANDGFSKRLHVGDTLAVPSLSQLKKKAAKADKKQKVVVQEPNSDGTYTVQAGDNLYSIARQFSTTTDKIRSLNNMGTSNAIHPGQVIRVQGDVSSTGANPGEVVHVVKKGEGLWDIARQYKVTIEEIVRWNGLKDTKVKVGDRLKIVKNP
jgi:membrane-bound lytic murein transglycosylase D